MPPNDRSPSAIRQSAETSRLSTADGERAAGSEGDGEDRPGTADGSGSPPPDPNEGPTWVEALLEAEGPVLQMIGSARPPGEVLEALCLMTESLCPGATCAVLLIDPSGRNLRGVAAPSLP